jgi:hypothetical protein
MECTRGSEPSSRICRVLRALRIRYWHWRTCTFFNRWSVLPRHAQKSTSDKKFSTANIFVGNYQASNNSQAAPILSTPAAKAMYLGFIADLSLVTPDGSDTDSGPWRGSPNKTDLSNSSSPSWSNLTFAVPGPNSSSHQVSFVNASTNNTNLITSGFTFYGNFLLVATSNSSTESLWYANPSGMDGIYALKWNATASGDNEAVPLTLRKTPPSNL